MRNCSLFGASFLVTVSMALGGCGSAGSEPDPGPVQRSPSDLRGAVWLGADPARGELLVLSHARLADTSVSEILVLGMDRRLRRTLDLRELGLSQDWPLAAPHHFPALGVLVVVSALDREVWAIELQTGRRRLLSSKASAVAADAANGVLFVAEEHELKILSLREDRTLAAHTFDERVPRELAVGSQGSLSFLFTGAGSRRTSWALLRPPQYEVQRTELAGAQRVAIQAVDDSAGHAFVQHSDAYRAELTVQRPGSAPERLAPDLVYPHVAGFWNDSPWLYVENDPSASPPGEMFVEMRVYDARTLLPVRSVEGRLPAGFHELERDGDGRLLVLRDGSRLERWDPLSLELEGAVLLRGIAGPWTVVPEERAAYLVLFEQGLQPASARLVRLQLDTFQVED
jgi:hypothetical protein